LIRHADDRGWLGNASLLNAMVGDIDDMATNGIVIRCAFARAALAQASKATA
jgi:hypothetical protein